MTTTSSHLDFCTATFGFGTDPNATLPGQFVNRSYQANGKGVHGYRTCLINAQGVLVLMDGSEAQGTHLVLSGVALTNLRDAGLTDRELCQFITDNGGKVTRLDLALNIHGGKLTPKQFARAYDAGNLKTPARSGLLRIGVKRPDQNFTLGNRTSNRYMRIYDKRAESHTDGAAWLRLELECHKLLAHAYADRLSSAQSTGAVVRGAIKDFCDMDNAEYREALSGAAETTPEVPRKLHNTLAWLVDQVAPAIVRYDANHPDSDALAILASAVANLRSASEGATADDAIYRG